MQPREPFRLTEKEIIRIMHIRMTDIASHIAALVAVVGVGAGGILGADSGSSSAPVAPTALVVDADAGRDGRELVDPRLRDIDADVRLPRSAEEARTNVRYFDALGYRVVVAGPQASAAASATGVPAERAPNLTGALQAVPR
jgi:hypothetical protein